MSGGPGTASTANLTVTNVPTITTTDIQIDNPNASQILTAISNLTSQMNNNFNLERGDVEKMNTTLSTVAQQISTHEDRIKELTELSTEHEKELDAIEGKMSNLQIVVLKEVSARSSCQKNIIVFGVHEDVNTTADQIRDNGKNLWGISEEIKFALIF